MSEIFSNGELHKIFTKLNINLTTQGEKLDHISKDVRYLVNDVKNCVGEREELRTAVARLKIQIALITTLATTGMGALFFFVFTNL